MNIHNPSGYLASQWDWTFLNDCFSGTNIRVTDIDGAVERNNHFLFLETKGDGVDIPEGQMIMYRNMTLDKRFVVMLIWGETNEPNRAQFIFHGKALKPFDCDADKLHNLVSKWFKLANGAK